MTLAEHLRLLRKQSRISLVGLSRISGIAERSIRYWESGEHEPRLPELSMLLKALNATPEQERRAYALLNSPQKRRQLHQSQLAKLGTQSVRPNYGDLLIALRLRRQMPAAQIALALNVSLTTLYRWEASKTLPSEDNLIRLCALLQAHPQEQEALLYARRQGFLEPSPLTLAEIEAQQAAFQQKVGVFESYHKQDDLIELEGICLEATLWNLAHQNAHAEQLLAQTCALHSAWLMRRGREEECLKYAQSALSIMRRTPEQQDGFWLDALIPVFAVYSLRGSVSGLQRAENFLKPWRSLLMTPELQGHWYMLMAILATKRNHYDSANALLAHTREAITRLPTTRAHYSPAGYEKVTQELHNDARMIQAFTFVHSGQFQQAFMQLPSPEVALYPAQALEYLLEWTHALLHAGEKTDAHAYLQRAYDCIATYDLNLWRRKADQLAERL